MVALQRYVWKVEARDTRPSQQDVPRAPRFPGNATGAGCLLLVLYSGPEEVQPDATAPHRGQRSKRVSTCGSPADNPLGFLVLNFYYTCSKICTVSRDAGRLVTPLDIGLSKGVLVTPIN